MLDDRTELKVSLARQNAVAVSRQLARGAAQVADLHPRQVLRGQMRQVLGLARPGEEMEDIEADARHRRAVTCSIKAIAVSRQAQNGDVF